MNKRYLVEFHDDTTKGVFYDFKIVWAADAGSAAEQILSRPLNWRIFDRKIIAVSELVEVDF